MFPVIFQIGPLKFYSFGLMVASGFLVTGFLLKRELRRTGLFPNLGDSIVIGAILGGIAGAKIYSAIEGWNELGAASLRTLFSGSGLVWYGGFAGGVIVVLIIIWRSRAPMMKVIDLIAPLLILGYAFGRMGCFLSGDGDYGPPTDLPWGMAFPNGVVPTLPGERVHPTPLYEIALSLAIFAFLWKMRISGRPVRGKEERGRRKEGRGKREKGRGRRESGRRVRGEEKIRERNLPTGWMFGMYLILAGVERFIIEFWRLTSVVALGMTMAQIISIILIGFGVVLILRSRKTRAMKVAS